ncbi:hypothetical protein HDV03_003742 [Kappamyces sp. JEL0829]|nr:hypothetical protein HDV03_003742 [Kappamyces sp. JEL0829]KAJ3343700.1 hypothetical protein HDU91_000341 [Kappamyces sp. JEL0680]
MNVLDAISLSVSAAIFIGYHFYFIYKTAINPSSTLSGWNYKVKARWVLETSKKKGGDILAVQTLRNWILAATFLATVSMTIAFGLLSFIVSVARVLDPTPGSLIGQLVNDPLLTIKTLLIISFNFLSFFSFSQSIRYFNHVGFAMGVPMLDHLDGDEETDGLFETVDHVASMLCTGSRFFTLGIRSFYFSILYVFWYFGPIYLLASSFLMIAFIYVGDLSMGASKICTKRQEGSALHLVVSKTV